MKRFNLAMALSAFTAIILLGCNTLTTGLPSSSASGVPQSIGAAIAAVFSGGQGQSNSGQDNPGGGSSCSDFEGEGGGGPDGVQVTASVAAGVYGPTSASVTVSAADDCEDDSANPDAFATFTMIDDVSATCDNGTTITLMQGSTGVYRNNETLGHYPEIYGTFNIRTDDGTEVTGIECTIFLDDQEIVVEATCEDKDGNTIDTTTSDVTCQFNTMNSN